MGALVRVLLFTAVMSVAWQAQAVIDPTAPPRWLAAPGSDAPAPAELAWVRVNGRQSVAWYGGTIVRLGEAVEGGRVAAIREDHIVIVGSQGRRAVYLLDPVVRARQSKKQR